MRLFFHGTGRAENDFVPIAGELSPGWPVLSPLGNHREGKLARYFRRFAEGHFDLNDLKFRALEMVDFVEWEAQENGWTPGRYVAIGYSMRANMAAAKAHSHPDALDMQAQLESCGADVTTELVRGSPELCGSFFESDQRILEPRWP